MKRAFIMMLAILCLQVNGQDRKDMIPGQPFPYQGSFYVEGMVNKQQTIADYKGKYLLLDLFGSNCVLCFQNMSKLDTLNRKLASKLNILMIGAKDYKLAGTYEKFKNRFNLTLPVSIDSAFFKNVQFYFLPTYIWIDPAGVVQAVTGPDRVTEENVERFINGQTLPFRSLPRPKPYEYAQDYLVNGNGGDENNFLVRSLLGRWNTELPYVFPDKLKFDAVNHNFNVLGVSKAQLYAYAYFGKPIVSFGDSLYGKTWTFPIFSDGNEDSEKKYCYSASFREGNPPNLQALLQGTLHNYFGYETHWVKKEMPVFIVTVDPALRNLLITKGDKQQRRTTHAHLDYRNVSMSQLLYMVAHYDQTDYPFIDETGIVENVDANIDAVLTEQKDFFEGLRKIGLIITKSTKIMDVLMVNKK